MVSDYADNPLVGYSLKYDVFADACRTFASGKISEKEMLAIFDLTREAAEKFLRYYKEGRRSGGRSERLNKLPFVVELSAALESALGDAKKSASDVAKDMADKAKFALFASELAAYIHLLQLGAAEELPRVLHTGKSPELVPENQIAIRE